MFTTYNISIRFAWGYFYPITAFYCRFTTRRQPLYRFLMLYDCKHLCTFLPAAYTLCVCIYLGQVQGSHELAGPVVEQSLYYSQLPSFSPLFVFTHEAGLFVSTLHRRILSGIPQDGSAWGGGLGCRVKDLRSNGASENRD